MRNGAVVESMRRAGAPYCIIFGLNLPQISEIARDFGPDRELALQLRANTASRESMLIAPMLFPREELTVEIAEEWLRSAPTTEVVDVACLKLIRYVEVPRRVIEALEASGTPADRYAALRLGANILPREMDYIDAMARRELERDEPLTAGVARMLIEDIDFRLRRSN